MIISLIKQRQEINKRENENTAIGLEIQANALYDFVTENISVGGEYVEMEFLQANGYHLVMRIDARCFMTVIEYQFRLAGFDNVGNLYPLVDTSSYADFMYAIEGK